MRRDRGHDESSGQLHFARAQSGGTSGQLDPKSKKRVSRAMLPDSSLSPENAPGASESKFRTESEQARPSERLRHADAPLPQDESADPGPAGSGADSHNDSGAAGEKAGREAKRLEKSKHRMERSGEKLDSARDKLAAQKPPKKPGPVKILGQAASHQAHWYVHGKIHEVEHENVGVEAAHKTEIVGEKVVRASTRFVKHRIRTRPARQVRKWEKRDSKARADYQYRQMQQEHPELKQTALTRFWQKRRLRWQNRKRMWQGVRGAGIIGAMAGKLGRAVRGIATRGRAWAWIALAAFLLVYSLQSCMAGLTTIGNGIVSVAGGTSYVATDEDIRTVEAQYAALEVGLRKMLDNIESEYPGYDEYNYSVDEIGHNPFELTSYLTTRHGGYDPGKVQADLQALLEQQYTSTVTETVEIRYRAESRTDTWIDAEGNIHSDTYTVEVPYDYYILNVTLRNHSLGAVAAANMDVEQTARYVVYQKLKGNRPYLFEDDIYAHPGEGNEYDIPPEALNDPAFAALIREAEKYLGYPYVWGGSKPSTSFDCSGFVCWVLNQSGIASVGRTNARGLYKNSTAVSRAEAQPGDLIFFTGARAAEIGHPVTHTVFTLAMA